MQSSEIGAHLERFSEAEVDAIFDAAQADRAYRVQRAATIALLPIGAIGLSLAIPVLLRWLNPSLPLRVVLAVGALAGIFFGVRALIRLGPRLLDRAVLRQIRLRVPGHGP